MIGISDDHLVTELLDEGFTAENIPVLYLTPALEVAWADGSVSDSERVSVLKFACEQGANKDSPAYGQLSAWLTHKPPAEFFALRLRLIGSVCGSQTPSEGKATDDKSTVLLLSDCGSIGKLVGLIEGLADGSRGFRQNHPILTGAHFLSVTRRDEGYDAVDSSLRHCRVSNEAKAGSSVTAITATIQYAILEPH